VPAVTGGRRADHADVPLLAGDGHVDQLRQDGALAPHPRAVPRVADDATDSEDLLRTMEVQASAAAALLRGRERSLGAGPRLVLRSGLRRLEHVRLRDSGSEE